MRGTDGRDAYHDEARRNFYRQERGKWSEIMQVMLERLAGKTDKRDSFDPSDLVPAEGPAKVGDG